MLTIDGSSGEGGGQILRTALALSTVTGKPFRIEKIRAGRPKPGLLRQHLTAVKAAATISGATVTSAELGSGVVTFSPGPVVAGDFAFAVGTAGSATLVLQTVLPALLTASTPCRLVLEGGTHNPMAPPFDFLVKSFLPLINRMGPTVTAELERAGFYPAGGGRLNVSITPAPRLLPFEMLDRGAIRSVTTRAIVANLPRSIAMREVNLAGRLLSLPEDSLIVEEIRGSAGPGNAVVVEIETERHIEVFTAFGEMNVRAEGVATKVVQDARAYIASGVPVGRYLADQLLIPMALAGAGRFRTGPLSRHTTTNLEVIRQFLEVHIDLIEEPKRTWTVVVADHARSTSEEREDGQAPAKTELK
jgi:RNA 3'-terminal phosphate cyclase (ATP)